MHAGAGRFASASWQSNNSMVILFLITAFISDYKEMYEYLT